MKIKIIVLFLLVSVFGHGQNTKYVNLFMGTSGDNGQLSPAATVPFGMIAVGPDSNPRTHAGYDYAIDKISGVSINRLSGVGCSGCGGNLSVRTSAPDQELHIIKSTEKATPGYYEVTFNNGVKGSFTATNNMAVQQYDFGKDADRSIWINFASSFEGMVDCEFKLKSNHEIIGYIQARNTCGHGMYKLYFHLSSNESFSIVKGKDKSYEAELRFEKSENPLELRIAVSPLDAATANLEAKQSESLSFKQLKLQANNLWENKLNKINLKGGSNDDRVIFYTSLYRIYMSPADVTTNDHRYLGSDGQIYKADGWRYFSSWSIWDTFRSKFPLLVITEPTLMRDICRSLLSLYRTGKKNWSTVFESTPTVRTEHASILLLDAYRKGIRDLDFAIGYEGMKKEADELPMASPDQKLESAYDLWALSQIAGIMGNSSDEKKYREQSEKLFEDTWTREFMQITPAFEIMKNNGLYQGTRWQYRWAAPQYIDQMIRWVGKDTLSNQLSYFFEKNLYNQGNEPDIHVPFLFNRFGKPESSQQLVRNLLTKEMTHRYGGNSEFKIPYVGRAFKNHPEGYSPEMDEDDGTMSAWYIFASAGFYPLLVGGDSYELVSPIFDRISIDMGNGKTFEIKTKGRKTAEDIIKRITMNGKVVSNYSISHGEMLKGGTLLFQY